MRISICIRGLVAAATLFILAGCAEWTCPVIEPRNERCQMLDTCVDDNTCNEIGTRCCSQTCGKTCQKVVKQGECPLITTAQFCGDCRTDDDCDSNKKCCSGNCCRDPEKKGQCPAEDLQDSCTRSCANDFVCPRDMKCCKGCCQDNVAVGLLGECPESPPVDLCIVCQSSADCDTGKKCCSKCCRTPVFTCQTQLCAKTALCRLTVVQCVRSPCPPQPACFDHPCSALACESGFSCVLRNDAASCSGDNCPVGQCQLGMCPVGQPFFGTYCGRGPDREDCPLGYFCQMDVLDRFAVCCVDQCPGGVLPLRTAGQTIRACGLATSASCPATYDCLPLNMTGPSRACCPSSDAAVRPEALEVVLRLCMTVIVARFVV